MKAIAYFHLAGLCALASLSAACAHAQTSEFAQPPKVLVIDREYTKPGKSGTPHEKSESAFVRAMAAAKWPTNYIAMDSLSGPSRALFVIGYESYAAWEKDNAAQAKDATLSAANDRAWAVDGELLTSTDVGVFSFRPDLSAGPPLEIANMRYFDITRLKVKPGHGKEFEELAKIYIAGFTKGVPDFSWAMYESIYGDDNGGVFLVIAPMKSLSEVDKSLDDNKKFEAAVGESGMRRLHELEAICLDSTQENLYHFNPKMSYASDHFKTVDAEFWNPKPALSPKPAAAPKPQ